MPDPAVERYVLHLAGKRMKHPMPGIDAELILEKLGEKRRPTALTVARGWLWDLTARGLLRELSIGGVYVPTGARRG